MHTLTLLGELDRASATTFEAAIERLCETDALAITVDLSKLTRIDATGVAVVAFRCRWCQQRGHELSLIPGTPSVQRAFELAGASERLPFAQPHPRDRAEPLPAREQPVRSAPRSTVTTIRLMRGVAGVS